MWAAGVAGSGNGVWSELAVTSVNPLYAEPVTAVSFDGASDLVWAGTEVGRVVALNAHDLSLAAYWPAHASPVLGLLPLPGAELALSLSAELALLSSWGGVRRAHVADEAGALFSCACFEGLSSGSGAAPRHALIGRHDGGVLRLDLGTSKTLGLLDFSGSSSPGPSALNPVSTSALGAAEGGVVFLSGPLSRGQVAVGFASGRLAIADPRANLKVDSGALLVGQQGGLVAMDARGNTVVCCGYGLRAASTPVAEPFVKAFDVRAGLLRPLVSIPVSGPLGTPCSLALHPLLSSQLLVGCSRGGLVLADTAIGAPRMTWAVEASGLPVTCTAISPSGEAWALGDAGGCVRVWAESTSPAIHPGGPAPAGIPSPLPSPPTVSLEESSSFSAALVYPLNPESGPRPLSDVDTHLTISVGLAPRLVDQALLASGKHVDFVTHVLNPYYVRGAAPGEAAAAVAALRNTRVNMKTTATRDRPDPAALRAERARQRALQGGAVLPIRFHRVEIKVQAGIRFEEFDFSFYNSTRFAGLENDLPNAYANSLLQVLYFTPALRAALLAAHIPEPDAEWCMSCELGLLFRMLAASHGTPCQAANLLRCLRQLREAAALGLLDAGPQGGGSAAQGGAEAVHDTRGPREWALGRKAAALSRFLLDQLHKEASSAGKAATPSHYHRSGIAQPAPANAGVSGVLEALFSLPLKQRLVALGGAPAAAGEAPAEKVREGRVFQIDLMYPMSKERASKAAADAGKLGFNRVPQAAAEALGLETTGSGANTGSDGKSSRPPSTPSSPTPPYAPSPTKTSASARPPGSPLPGAGSSGVAVLDPLTTAGGTTSEGEATDLEVDLQQQQVPERVNQPLPRKAPSFADQLARSLVAVNETRAWFDEARGYTHVRQSRVPTRLPQLLGIDTSIGDGGDVSWWEPDLVPEEVEVEEEEEEGEAAEGGRVRQRRPTGKLVEVPRLPWALCIESDPDTWQVAVSQGDTAAELWELPAKLQGKSVERAFYELRALICQIRDIDEEAELRGTSPPTAASTPGTAAAAAAAAGGNYFSMSDIGTASAAVGGGGSAASTGAKEGGKEGQAAGQGGGPVYEGHLQALVRVPEFYWEEAPLGSPLGAPGGPPAPPGSAAALAALAPGASGNVMSAQGSLGRHGTGGPDWAAGGTGAGGPAAAEVANIPGLDLPDSLDDIFSTSPPPSTLPAARSASGRASRSGSGAPGGIGRAASAASTTGGASRSGSLATGAARASSIAGATGVAAPDGTTPEGGGAVQTGGGQGDVKEPAWVHASRAGGVQRGWLLLNDFAVSNLTPGEVLATYGGQKVPCLVYYSRVDTRYEDPVTPAALTALMGTSLPAPASATPSSTPSGKRKGGDKKAQAAAAAAKPAVKASLALVPPPDITPVLTADNFSKLCLSPPLQGPAARLPPYRFRPLDVASEAPRPGMLLGLDAEFVMVSPPEKTFEANMEVLIRQARLALARVSVVRGEGPSAGLPCIDDHVRCAEPIHDHLTRYSGLVPGDLEPTTSRHYLTTSKHSYLKLRYLVDTGAVLVGHGLRKDLRIINITVPPEQIVDTVELFSFRRQRKMSLRFLASYLLGLQIQAGGGHDSIEDARAALQLYDKYKQLLAAGTLNDKISEMYSWGKAHGWEPVTLDRSGHPIPPSALAPLPGASHHLGPHQGAPHAW